MTENPLSEAEIAAALEGSAWSREGETIVRELKLANFLAAIAAAGEIATVAEQLNHHPDLLIHGYNKLRLTLSTHSAGGLTARDFELARAIDALALTGRD